MKRVEPVIISCAITGSVHTPSMSPYLPITPDEIARQAIEAAEAGAAILHLHARNPADGAPTPDPEAFMAFLPRIKQGCDAVINITTGGSNGMSLDERLAAPARAAPELASLNMGSMNFDFSQAARRVHSWKHAWERDYILGSSNRIALNTPDQIARICRDIGQRHGTRFEFECYDVGHLYMLAHIVEQQLVEAPFFIQCVLGVLGGIGADPANLDHMIRIADKLFGDDWMLSVLAAGRHQMALATMSILCGGHVRVGLEDSLFISRGQLARSNAEQVVSIRTIAEALGRRIATPAEARALLGLKGGDAVGF